MLAVVRAVVPFLTILLFLLIPKICEPGSISTVFTAIQVALGANASHLDVVNHLRELVKCPEGSKNGAPATIARVCLTIENGSDDGYERDIYGDEIQIERYISSRGGCYGFKLLGVDGVEQSCSKNDLFTLLSYLKIGIDNPAAILKQVRAKRVGQPKDMYRFFSSATRLDVVSDAYNNVSEEIARYDVMVVSVVTALPNAQRLNDVLVITVPNVITARERQSKGMKTLGINS